MKNLMLVVVIASSCMVVRARFCQMTAVTYNTALRDRSIDSENIIPNNRVERRDQIIQMLDNTDADLICLQEVWIGEDVEAIVDGVKSNFPYSMSEIHHGNKVKGVYGSNQGPVCDFLTLFAVTDCVTSSCPGVTTFDEYWLCMNTTCNSQYTDFHTASSGECIACVFTALPNITGIMESCAGAGINDDYRKINRFGLVVLSKRPLRESGGWIYHESKQFFERGMLYSFIQGIAIGCTQLSGEMTTFYAEEYLRLEHGITSYEEQNFYEAIGLIGDIPPYPILILADFNSGWDFESNINVTMGESFDLLSSEQYNTLPVSECTVCDRDENPYNVDNENYITDGFLGYGLKVRYVKRIYTQADGSIEYNSQTLPLSDHYGVEGIILRDFENLNFVDPGCC